MCKFYHYGKIGFYLFAMVGIIDMFGQAWTGGEFKLIHTILGVLF